MSRQIPSLGKRCVLEGDATSPFFSSLSRVNSHKMPRWSRLKLAPTFFKPRWKCLTGSAAVGSWFGAGYSGNLSRPPRSACDRPDSSRAAPHRDAPPPLARTSRLHFFFIISYFFNISPPTPDTEPSRHNRGVFPGGLIELIFIAWLEIAAEKQRFWGKQSGSETFLWWDEKWDFR